MPFDGYASSNQIKVFVDGTEVPFVDAQPYIDGNGRTLVPVRFPAEAVGATVDWNNDAKQVTVSKDHKTVILSVNQREYIVNHMKMQMDTEMIYNSQYHRNFVPIRFVLEGLGYEVGWQTFQQYGIIHVFTDGQTVTQKNTIYKQIESRITAPQMPSVQPVETTQPTAKFIVDDLAIGSPLEDLIKKRGNPDRMDASQYDFQWYVYNKDYSNYLQVGVKDKRIVALHSSAVKWSGVGNLAPTATKKNVRDALGEPLRGLRIGNTMYLNSYENRDVYLVDESYYAYFDYDAFDKDIVQSVLLLDKKSRETLPAFHSAGSTDLRKAFEYQVFDLTNAVRQKKGLSILKWNEQAAITARKHSEDMAKNNFFDHINLQGQSPFDRMRADGIRFRSAAENLVAGSEDAVQAVPMWMNSKGHREAMLSRQELLGVGVAFGGRMNIYFTQKFFTP